jgi:broad specificity phosphatase PhoE
MTGRIVTVRHGRPDVDRDMRISAREYGDWWTNYDKTGLAPDQHPPDSLLELAAECDVILCSTMPRAIETAAKLVDAARIVPQDAIFVEAPLPAPPIPLFKMSPTSWGRVSRAFWFVGYAPDGMESHRDAIRRVRRVTDRLIEFAERGEDVLLCAHGYLNWMIDGHIRRRGWTRITHVGDNDYWSYRAYRETVPATAPAQGQIVAEGQ